MVFPNGYKVVTFENGDVKQTLPDETVIYFYTEYDITQISLPDGTEIYRFKNKQVEFHKKDGQKEIRFEDGSCRYIMENGENFIKQANGTLESISSEGVKLI